MAIELSTEDKLEYVFYPVAKNQIQFRVKAANDAHIALTTTQEVVDPMLEVFIGGWKNKKSVIRKNNKLPDVAEAFTEGILSDGESRGFWIRWTTDGELAVGKEEEPDPFMSYTNPEPFQINYFGVLTAWGATGEWVIEVEQEPTAPADDQIVGATNSSSTMWIDATAGEVPQNAVMGGEDEGEILFVGRANHEGAVIPGKVKPGHGVCYIPHGGEEHGKTEYQVLCSSNTSWIATSDGNIPPNAIPTGQAEDGEPLFTGRVTHEGSLTIGKVHPSHRVVYIPYGGKEIAFGDYEILVAND